jgi:hypothetical protein
MCVLAIVQPDGQTEVALNVGTDIEVGCDVTYRFSCDTGGYCHVLDAAGSVIFAHAAEPTDNADDLGGGIVATAECQTIVFGPTVAAYKCVELSVGEILADATSVGNLRITLAHYGFADNEAQEVINLYLEGHIEKIHEQMPIKATQAEYDALDAAGKLSKTNPYLIVRDGS